MPSMVMCTKLGRELEGFEKPPWSGEIGLRIEANISKEAWKLWLEHAKMVINEYRLNLGTPEAQKIIAEQMESFLFGDSAAPPPDYVPPSSES
jgi:Fe-S cluster biosynthesis and repair protein YggX